MRSTAQPYASGRGNRYGAWSWLNPRTSTMWLPMPAEASAALSGSSRFPRPCASTCAAGTEKSDPCDRPRTACATAAWIRRARSRGVAPPAARRDGAQVVDLDGVARLHPRHGHAFLLGDRLGLQRTAVALDGAQAQHLGVAGQVRLAEARYALLVEHPDDAVHPLDRPAVRE